MASVDGVNAVNSIDLQQVALSFSATQAEPVLRAAPRLAGLGRLCL